MPTVKFSTITLYLAAGGLSLALSLLLLAFAHMQPGTRAARHFALSIALLAVGMTLLGLGPGLTLPLWATAFVANMVLLAAAEVMYGGFAAFCETGKPGFWGWALIGSTALPFWYWGWIEPNGNYRAVVWSWAVLAINIRSAWVLGRTAMRTRQSVPIWVLAGLYGILCVWMGIRGVSLLFADLPTPHRSSNPTTWVSVFWFIVLLSVVTFCFLWMEVDRLNAGRKEQVRYLGSVARLLGFFSDHFWLLWGAVVIVILAIAAEMGVIYSKFYALELEKASSLPAANLAHNSWLHLQPLAFGALGVVLVVLALATLLTREMHRRMEQERFMSMLNHEMKTPMSVIRMALELTPVSISSKEYALQAVQDMNAIVDRCLQVDRLHQGRLVRSVSACNIPELLEELRLACAQSQRIVVQAPPVLPTLYTDPQLMRIIVSNLIDNALKYAATDSLIEIQAWQMPDKHTDGILVSISNLPGAAGFPNPQQVFKKYYRSPGAHGKTGSGLGLYLAHSLARMLGGRLRYTPDANAVRFTCWLPLSAQ